MAIELNTEQRRQAIEIMYAYLLAPPNAEGRKVLELEAEMETDVNEVCLVEADALVAMVDAKMRHPHTYR